MLTSRIRDSTFRFTVGMQEMPPHPDREEALIGAIVLEELNLLRDCPAESVHPRDPDRIITEIELIERG